MTASDEQKIEQLILLLSRVPKGMVGKDELTEVLGMTSTTLESWIDGLRNQGLEIEGQTDGGYRLAVTPDLMLPQWIQSQLQSLRFGRIVHYRFQVGSTNDVAQRMAHEGAEEGVLVIAEEQTQGRGRLGRSWLSERNAGIYASLVLRPQMKPRQAPLLNLAAAVAASEAIEHACGIITDIKWPNDLLVDGRKCCGILAEMSAELDEIKYVIMGIGINVNHRQFPGHLHRQASSLFLEGKRSYSRVEILCRLLERFEGIYHELQRDEGVLVIERWARRSSYAWGKSVRVELGGREIQGVTAGLGDNGTLHVKLADGRIEEVTSGDVVAWR